MNGNYVTCRIRHPIQSSDLQNTADVPCPGRSMRPGRTHKCCSAGGHTGTWRRRRRAHRNGARGIGEWAPQAQEKGQLRRTELARVQFSNAREERVGVRPARVRHASGARPQPFLSGRTVMLRRRRRAGMLGPSRRRAGAAAAALFLLLFCAAAHARCLGSLAAGNVPMYDGDVRVCGQCLTRLHAGAGRAGVRWRAGRNRAHDGGGFRAAHREVAGGRAPQKKENGPGGESRRARHVGE
eukprot:gene24814-biopygen8968